MEKLVLNAIKQFELLKNVDNITVALSGGADSVSLLYVLNSLKEKLGITLSAAHLNHMIRGAEADRDEAFVTSICQKLGIKLFCERIDVPEYAEKHRLSTELAAREVRYDFLNRVNTGVVATAHTASDNLETMLFNLTRGASLKGLCGIPPKREIFIRPLLLCTREDVENYCTENKISFVTDSTNLCDEYTRNKIRHNVIPVLKTINPSVEIAALRSTFSLNEDESFISACADSYLSNNIGFDSGLEVSGFKNLSSAVSKRIIKKYFVNILKDVTLDNRHICDIYSICLNGGRVSLPKNMSAVVSNSILRAVNTFKTEDKEKYSLKIEMHSNEFFKNNEKVNNLLLKNSLDCDKIVGKSLVRFRMPGDSIRIANRGCTKSLKKLFNECHIPIEERDVLPVIADDIGVIWVCGIGPAHRCAVTKASKNILIIDVEKAKNNMN